MNQQPSRTSDLYNLCLDLSKNKFPHVSNPPGCKRRASVALIIRVRPSHSDNSAYPAATTDPTLPAETRLDSFFSQSWVENGAAEVLFIKRAARQGDRFTSHVAFPGGKRDADDADDRATAIRETDEEVGVDLAGSHVVYIGNLAQRIVTAEWGTVPLLVLCPFVFLLTRYDIPPLKLQPTEVHSAHWVPLSALMHPGLRTYERADLSDRLTKQGGPVLRWMCRLLVGQMLFAATRLVPSESNYCVFSHLTLPTPLEISNGQVVHSSMHPTTPRYDAQASASVPPLLLWGLTYGIVADFLDLFPSFDVTEMWRWPTFSAIDVRLVIWLVTRRFRLEKTKTIRPRSQVQATFVKDEGFGAIKRELSAVQRAIHDEHRLARAGAVGHLLFGYFNLVKRAVRITMVSRMAVLALFGAYYLRRWRRRAS